MKLPKQVKNLFQQSKAKDYDNNCLIFINKIENSNDVEIKIVSKKLSVAQAQRFSLSKEDWLNIGKVMDWKQGELNV